MGACPSLLERVGRSVLVSQERDAERLKNRRQNEEAAAAAAGGGGGGGDGGDGDVHGGANGRTVAQWRKSGPLNNQKLQVIHLN